jgi:radical SAM superfamily enzyme YgiQ (UPF0313 family)
VQALLISTYELGRQPFGLASPAAWLRREGVEVACVDAAKQTLTDESLRAADLIALHLPMHTATRLAVPVLDRIRAVNPAARVCAYGLYAPLNARWLWSMGVSDILGGEFEEELALIARLMVQAPDEHDAADSRVSSTVHSGEGAIPRLQFLVPDRSGLPPLSNYAALRLGDGEHRLVGYTEASRGCRHLCRHCPVVPVYKGHFRVVPAEVVLADIASQAAAGAQHITFGDPDFFNGPSHSLRIVEAMHAAHPELTYDVTIKVEHLLKHRSQLETLRDTGCLFVTTAAESFDDRVLELLAKGHTRGDFIDALAACRKYGITLMPTFVAFHPWTTLDGYCDLLDTIEALDLVDHVAPIQLAIRLLIPEGSRLLELEDIGQLAGPFDAGTLMYPWMHRDPRVDRLHQEITDIVGTRLTSDRRHTFETITTLAHRRAGLPRPDHRARVPRSVPYLDEPWYCCAEPNPLQMVVV